MRTAVVATAVLVLCLALALAQTPPSFALSSNVDDHTNHGVADLPGSSVLTALQASSRDLVPDLVHPHPLRRSLKVKKTKTKWAAGAPTLLGTVITVAIVVAVVVIFVVWLLITEKKKQDPKWRVRDLFKRRLKPSVKRTLTRRFTRKTAAGGDPEFHPEVEKPKIVEDGVLPPKV